MDLEKQVLSDIIVHMKYAKYNEGLRRREVWTEIVDRNKGMHIKKFPAMKETIEKAYKYVYDYKVLPAMRSLQFAGVPIELSNSRLFNCAAMSMDHKNTFSELMFLLLGGSGVGISVQSRHISKLPTVKGCKAESRRFLVSDNIEGWASAIKVLVESHFKGKETVKFDFRDIREKGAALVTSGGKAPGADPLRICIENIDKVFKGACNRQLRSIEVFDICTLIADAVLAGGIRRAAIATLFDKYDKDMLECKKGMWYKTHPHRARSNNSAVLVRGEVTKDDFFSLMKTVENNNTGEPGVFWTNDPDWLTNPCFEIALKSNQFCNLVDINASNITDKQDFLDRCAVAATLSTIQAAYTDFHYIRPEWKKAVEEDYLIGVGQTGIASLDIPKEWLNEGAKLIIATNKEIADDIGIKPASRTTTVKPAGCRPWDGLVTTDKGIFTLEELFKDHDFTRTRRCMWSDVKMDLKAIQDKGNTNNLVKTFNNGVSQVFNINMSGGLQVQSTKNHPWYVTKQYSTCGDSYTIVDKFVDTCDLKDGMVIDVNMGAYNNDVPYKLSTVGSAHRNMRGLSTDDKREPLVMDSDLAWLIGYMCSSRYKDFNNKYLLFKDPNKCNLDKVDRILQRHFGGICERTYMGDRDMLYYHNTSFYTWYCNNNDNNNNNNNNTPIGDTYTPHNLLSTIDTIPICVRRSSKEHIIAYFSGIVSGDGYFCPHDGLVLDMPDACDALSKSFLRHLQNVLLSVGIHISYRGGADATPDTQRREKHRVWMGASIDVLYTSNKDSLDYLTKHYVNKELEPLETINYDGFKSHDIIMGKIDRVTKGDVVPTFDVEVAKDPWFYAGAFKSHNTSSLLLGCSSGVHAWHDEYYIRRITVMENEAIFKYLQATVPELLEEHSEAKGTWFITMPQKAPKGAVTRNEGMQSLLDRVLKYNKEWIAPGHESGANKHNVSCTIPVKEHEWEQLSNWMWDNRYDYNGIATQPYWGGTALHMPFETCSEEKYKELLKYVKHMDLRLVTESSDTTDLTGEAACGGNGCEI